MNSTTAIKAPEWMIQLMRVRERLFLQTVEPIIVALLGPVVQNETMMISTNATNTNTNTNTSADSQYQFHRRLSAFDFFLPDSYSNVKVYKETSMSFATLVVLFAVLSGVFMIFLSCFYHNQKTSPLFTSPRRHRLPKLVPPPLPVDGYVRWIQVCLFLSEEEIIARVGYDSLIFLRFHRLALRCIVKMSVFSCVVLLPLNFTGGGHANAKDLAEYVGSLFYTDFLRFTMANVVSGSPRLWVHCFAAYLLTAIVCRELLKEYEMFHSIRHRYLLSREPHLRTVLVTNIPRHLRSASKITSYFRHVYPDAVKQVFMCQNLIQLQTLIQERTEVLSSIEKELLVLCRTEKKKLYQQSFWKQLLNFRGRLEDCGVVDATQERLAHLYNELERYNELVEAGEGAADIDYVLANPFLMDDPTQRRVLGLPAYAPPTHTGVRPPVNPERNQRGEYPGQQQDVTEMNQDAHGADRGISLRSRSPGNLQTTGINIQEGDGLSKDGKPRGGRRKSRIRPIARVKHVIRQYARFDRDTSFLGRPIFPSSAQNDRHIEEHINEVTDKAFVVMRTFTAATIAIQSMHSSKPGAMHVTTAPEPRDILWNNIYVSKGAHRTRSILGEILVLLIITFYIVPITLVSFLVSESALISTSPRLAQLDAASAFFSAAIALVQPLCIVSLQQLLPPLFMLIGQAEGMPSFSEVQMRAFSRYFLFQVINIFLVTTIAGSFFDTISIIVQSPESAFEMLGTQLPRMSSFFITFVTIKTFIALGVELVRSITLVQAMVRYLFIPNATLRQQRSIIFGCRSIDDPGWFPYHKILAQDMLVVVISVVFAVVAPMVLLPCAIFIFFSRIMWTHHHLYVYEAVFESGGQFFPKIFRRFVFGLIIAQMTITGQFILKDARHEAYATIALMFLTYFFLRATRARYDPSSSTLPLEVATVMDISLKHDEEEAARRMALGEKSNLDDSFVGRYDPFRQAYLQPPLRANPRARPEQPFPAAQLGREEGCVPDSSRRSLVQESEDVDWRNSGATVRLKSLNQQERRLINRWWKEQLENAGDQNLLAVLIGERCGNLTLSTASTADAELYESSSQSTRAQEEQDPISSMIV
jgi:hypothetical protein